MKKIQLLTVISFASLIVACGGSSTHYVGGSFNPDGPQTAVPPTKPSQPRPSMDTEETLFWIGENTLSDLNASVDLRLNTRKNGMDGEGETVDIKLHYDPQGNLRWSSPKDVQSLVIPGIADNNGKGVTSTYGFLLPVNGELTAFSLSENIDEDLKKQLVALSPKGGKLNYSGDVTGATIDDKGALVINEGSFNLSVDPNNFEIIGTIISHSSGSRSGQESAFGDTGKLTIAGKVYDHHFSGIISGKLNGKEASSDFLGQFNSGGKNVAGHWNGDFSGGLTGKFEEKPSALPHHGVQNQPAIDNQGNTYYLNTFTSYDDSLKNAKLGKEPIYLTIYDNDGLQEHTVKISGDRNEFTSTTDPAGNRGTAIYVTDNGYYGMTRYKNSLGHGWLDSFNVANTTDPDELQALRDNAVAGQKAVYTGTAHASNTLHNETGFLESKIQKGNVTIGVDFKDAKLDGRFDGAPIFKNGLEFDGSFDDKGVISASGGFVGEQIRDTKIHGQFAGQNGEEIIGNFSSDYSQNQNTLMGGFSATKE